jgi:arylsulfatase A-like enzyme
MSISQLFANGNLPNIVLIITDQERTIQHWSASFLCNLPAMRQLMNTGLTFQNAFTGACMCSPSRATFLTSNYPAVTGVTTTGTPEPPHVLPPPATFPNLATVLAKAGYETIVWKGKWHLGPSPEDAGFSAWDPPDAGNALSDPTTTLGGGTDNNDTRFLGDVLSFLGSLSPAGAAPKPFCLVASFVNAHDIYVATESGPVPVGYPIESYQAYPVPLPANNAEDLSTKPRAQAGWAWQAGWNTNATQQQYVNFYAYLQVLVDQQIMQILTTIANAPYADNTLIIRIADHGEMGVSHGLVEKFYNAYEETIHIPLIFSNPAIWPAGQTTASMASLLDLMPTLASLLGVSGDFTGFKGQDLSPILENPSATLQNNFVHFTYDDEASTVPGAPSIVRTLRTPGYTYSVYFLSDGSDADWELYDLLADPLQNDNVAGQAQYGTIQESLDQQLQQTMTAMGTAPSFTWPPKQTSNSRGGPPNVG